MIKLQYRKVKPLDDGRFDCEINHPDFGWIPFTVDPDDVELHGRQLFESFYRIYRPQKSTERIGLAKAAEMMVVKKDKA